MLCRVIAEHWRGFEPTKRTSIETRFDLNTEMMVKFQQKKLVSIIDSAMKSNVDVWPFPVWSLDLSTKRISRQRLKSQRAAAVEWITTVEAIKDPRPVISRGNVMMLNRLHQADKKKVDAIGKSYRREHPKKVGTPSSLVRQRPSLEMLKRALEELTEQERIDLLAFAWFTRDRIANWSARHRYATERI